MASAAIAATLTIQLGKRGQQLARQATLTVRWKEITLRPPNSRSKEKLPNITVWAVWACETTPPAGEEEVEWLLLTTVPLTSTEDALSILEWYAARWGIESGYRLMEQVRARTNSPNSAVRFLLMAVALLIVNMWIRLHWLFLRLPGRGPRRVARWRFRFERMKSFLTRAIERFYGVVTVVDPAPT